MDLYNLGATTSPENVTAVVDAVHQYGNYKPNWVKNQLSLFRLIRALLKGVYANSN